MMLNKSKIYILIYGPKLTGNPKGYGGGKGGIVSAMKLIVGHFSSGDIKINYVSYGARTFNKLWPLMFPLRLIIDLKSFALNLKGAALVHIVANSGPALFRTLAATCLSKLFSVPVLLDVRGNGLDAFAEKESRSFYAVIWQLIIFLSDKVFVQRMKTANILSSTYQNKIMHQPNMISHDDIGNPCKEILSRGIINVLFVGYCYREKGVFDIAEGCSITAKRGLDINLTFIGEEHEEFSRFLNAMEIPAGLSIKRLGRKDRVDVMSSFSCSDIFMFPTYHKGEGHPNVLNEAMAYGLAIVTTHWGAIDELLDDDTAYFVDAQSPTQIADRLCHISENKNEARMKGSQARERLIARYSAKKVLKDLETVYRTLSKKDQS